MKGIFPERDLEVLQGPEMGLLYVNVKFAHRNLSRGGSRKSLHLSTLCLPQVRYDTYQKETILNPKTLPLLPFSSPIFILNRNHDQDPTCFVVLYIWSLEIEIPDRRTRLIECNAFFLTSQRKRVLPIIGSIT